MRNRLKTDLKDIRIVSSDSWDKKIINPMKTKLCLSCTKIFINWKRAGEFRQC